MVREGRETAEAWGRRREWSWGLDTSDGMKKDRPVSSTRLRNGVLREVCIWKRWSEEDKGIYLERNARSDYGRKRLCGGGSEVQMRNMREGQLSRFKLIGGVRGWECKRNRNWNVRNIAYHIRSDLRNPRWCVACGKNPGQLISFKLLPGVSGILKWSTKPLANAGYLRPSPTIFCIRGLS